MPHFISPLPSSNTITPPVAWFRSSSFLRNEYPASSLPSGTSHLPCWDGFPFIRQTAFVYGKTNGIGFSFSFFYILELTLLGEMICSSFVPRKWLKNNKSLPIHDPAFPWIFRHQFDIRFQRKKPSGGGRIIFVNRPTVFVNVAMTADGKIDSSLRQGAGISSIPDKARVDRLRARMDAVLVGGRTLLDEDPRLTVKSLALREERKALGLPENPAKVGVVSKADINLQGEFVTVGPARRLIYTTSRTTPDQVAALQETGTEVFLLGGTQVDLPAMLDSLYSIGIRNLLVEGGGTLIAEFFCLGLVDELTIYIAPKIFCGTNAPTLADGKGLFPEQAPALMLVSVEKYDAEGGVLLQYRLSKTN
jgi:2,5-diamino-6-(ribosylamino)-4(3H)-pyrimidinone 5'-phosphate reductase